MQEKKQTRQKNGHRATKRSLMRRTLVRKGSGVRPAAPHASNGASPAPAPAPPPFHSSPQAGSAPVGVRTEPNETCPGAVEEPDGRVRQEGTSSGGDLVTPERTLAVDRCVTSRGAGRPALDQQFVSDRFGSSQPTAIAPTSAVEQPSIVVSSPTSPARPTTTADAEHGESVQRPLVV